MVSIRKGIQKTRAFLTRESVSARKVRLAREAELNRLERKALFEARKAEAGSFARKRARLETSQRLKRAKATGGKKKPGVAGQLLAGLARGTSSQSILGSNQVPGASAPAPAPRRRRRKVTRRKSAPRRRRRRSPARSQSQFGLSAGF